MEPLDVNIPATREKYAAARSDLFPTLGALEWRIRQYRAELIDAGALLAMGGRWMVHPARFDAAMVAIGERHAKESFAHIRGSRGDNRAAIHAARAASLAKATLHADARAMATERKAAK